jgi:hypothetical protein
VKAVVESIGTVDSHARMGEHDNVLRHAPCPVVIIRGAKEG